MRRNLLALASAAAVTFGAIEASAYEHQWHAGGAFGWSYLAGPGAGFQGFGGMAHVDYGVFDALNLVGQLELTAYPGGKLLVPSASVGAAGVLDIFSVVPTLGLTMGIADATSTKGGCADAGGCSHVKLAIGAPWSLDYLVSRSFAFGLRGQYQLLLIGDSPLHRVDVMAHAEYQWGY